MDDQARIPGRDRGMALQDGRAGCIKTTQGIDDHAGAGGVDERQGGHVDGEVAVQADRLAEALRARVDRGVGAEIAFRIREALGTPRIARVGALAAPVSSNPVLEAACLPDAQTVIAAIQRLLAA